MCEIHQQIVHIYFLLRIHTHTEEKALSAKMKLGLQRETVSQRCNFHPCFS